MQITRAYSGEEDRTAMKLLGLSHDLSAVTRLKAKPQRERIVNSGGAIAQPMTARLLRPRNNY
jgi:hypothetical protein